MTVSSDLARVQYSGNSTSSVFSTGFAFLQNADVKLILATAGVETPQVENTHYTLSGAGTEAAGVVTMVTAPPTGTVLTIMRDVEFVQDLDGNTLSTMDAGDQEIAYDKIWHALGQLKDANRRTLHTSDGATGDTQPVGWVPILAVVADGARSVLQVIGWAGNTGTPPAVGGYIGPSGYTAVIASAIDIRGAQGLQGVVGPTGPTGPTGPQGPIGVGVAGPGTGDMLRSNNLSDVLNTTTARTSLGLGNSATLNVGTAASTVAAGNDSRFTTLAAGVAAAAPLASPALTGNPTAPTPTAGDNDTSIATTSFVTDAVAASVPATATAAEYRANSAPTKMLTPGAVWSAAALVTLADTGGTITPNLALGFDFNCTLTGSARTMVNPINPKAGQKGIIFLGGGSVTTWGSAWKFSGGIKPTSSGGTDMLSYYCDGANMWCTASANFS